MHSIYNLWNFGYDQMLDFVSDFSCIYSYDQIALFVILGTWCFMLVFWVGWTNLSFPRLIILGHDDDPISCFWIHLHSVDNLCIWFHQGCGPVIYVVVFLSLVSRWCWSNKSSEIIHPLWFFVEFDIYFCYYIFRCLAEFVKPSYLGILFIVIDSFSLFIINLHISYHAFSLGRMYVSSNFCISFSLFSLLSFNCSYDA